MNKNKVQSKIRSFLLEDVLLTDAYYINANQKEIEYLSSFDVDKLLVGFRETAGLDTKGSTRYQGWEDSLIAGHTLGHYLTACCQGYENANTSNDNKTVLLSKIEEIILGLKECQDQVGTGYIFGATLINKENIEQQFDNVENNKTNIFTQAWVPWYTMHKLIAGLVSVASLDDDMAKTVSKTALDVVSALGDWTYERVSKWSDKTRSTVLAIEYGGMNDCLYDLYSLSKDEKHAAAAHAFDQEDLFERVLKAKPGENVLNNLHANTTIPKFMGALNRYITYKDKKEVDVDIYLDYVKAFWELVVNNHTYITGGNSEWEHFGLDDVLDAERTNCNCETCNAYNMLRLTKKLFMLTGDVKYADYYENVYLNSVISSQNPETGMTMYFQPMDSGYFKVYNEEYNMFWCCVGSGMENFTKLGESFYFRTDNTLIVNQYISSKLRWSQKDIIVSQETNIPESDQARFIINTKSDKKADINLSFRIPDWIAADPIIKVDGKDYNYDLHNGYAFVNGPFKDNTTINIKLAMEVRAYSLADADNVYGFKYGPVVISALLGMKDMKETTTGVDVTIPMDKYIEKVYTPTGNETLVVITDTVKDFIDNINDYMVRDKSADKLTFKLENVEADLNFVTHYSQHKERYGIYWKFVTKKEYDQILKDQEKDRKAIIEELRLDTVQPGYGQYENDKLHNMKEYGSGSTGDTSAGTSRRANPDGAFSYRMIVDLEQGTNLLATFKREDNGEMIRIKVGDKLVYEQVLDNDTSDEEYDVIINLPTKVLKDKAEKVTIDDEEKTVVTFMFEGNKGEASARLCNFLYSLKKFDDISHSE